MTETQSGSGAYRTDQQILLRFLLSAIAAGLLGVLVWLVVNTFSTQSGMALLNLKVDMVMERMHIDPPKAAK